MAPSSLSQMRVSRRQPCPICGKTKGCLIYSPRSNGSQDVLCVRLASERPVETGLGGWLHAVAPGHIAPSPLPTILRSARLAPIETRHLVYQALLGEHPLLERHARELGQRGLSAEAIERRGYRSWGCSPYTRAPIARTVLEIHPQAVDVPGLLIRNNVRGQQYATLAGSPGIAIPLRDPAGQIQAMQILVDDKSDGKYRFLSSASRGGSSPGTPVHVARPPAEGPSSGRIWLTEGGLKADISAELLQEIVVAVPGVNSLSHLPDTLQQLQRRGELTSLVVALDMDYHQKAAVKKARNLIAERAARMGIPVWMADWPVECKGLDDLLTAGGHPRLTAYQVQGNGPRPVSQEETPSAAPPKVATVSLEEARRQIANAIDHYLERDRQAEPDLGLLLGAAPGTGKSHAITKSLNRAIKKKRRRRIALFVARHEQAQEEPGREAWAVVRGRTHADQEAATPCAYPEQLKKLSQLRILGQSACQACPQQEACRGNSLRKGREPFYLNQFEPKVDQRITVYQAAHLMTPNAWRTASTLVIDDVDPDNLQIEPVVLKRPDLEHAVDWMARHPNHQSYALAQPLIHLCSELTRSSPTGEFSLSGPELIARLAQLAQEHGIALQEAIEQARLAQEPDPFPEGENALPNAHLDVPKRFVADLAGVLAHELQQSQLEREVTGWNRRIRVSRSVGADVELTLWLRRDLPIQALTGKDLIIVDGSLTVEEASRRFPHIKRWIVVDPKVEIPSSVKVVQFIDRAWGKRALYDAEVQRKALEVIGSHLADHPGEKVALLTYKFFAEIARKKFPELQVGSFYSQRGSNKFKDCDVEIVFGTPRPNPAGFLQTAETLHWDSTPINHQTTLQQRRIGSHLVKIREFLDPRLQQLSRAKTEQEMVQAVLRIRPLSVAGFLPVEQGEFDFGERQAEVHQQRKRATVYIHSNQPLPGIKVEVRRLGPTPPPARAGLVEPYLEAAQQLLQQQKRPTETLLARATGRFSLYRVRAWKSSLEQTRQPVGAGPPR